LIFNHPLINATKPSEKIGEIKLKIDKYERKRQA
jgi:hypothetical protein